MPYRDKSKQKEAQRLWYLRKKKCPDYIKRKKGNKVKWKYNLTLEEYEAIINKPQGKCPICGYKSKTKPLVLDHHHETGAIREAICHWCNSGIGYFKESIVIMKEAIKYLKKHEKARKTTKNK